MDHQPSRHTLVLLHQPVDQAAESNHPVRAAPQLELWVALVDSPEVLPSEGDI